MHVYMCVQSYKYLRIHFTAPWTFTLAYLEFYKKGIEILFQTTGNNANILRETLKI